MFRLTGFPDFRPLDFWNSGLLALWLLTAPSRAALIHPEPVPDPAIAGFRFPESEATITGWVADANRATSPTAAVSTEKIQLHGWGLWTAITSPTSQAYAGQPLRVFETWFTPEDLTANGGATSVSLLAQLPRQRAALREIPQAGPRPPSRPPRRGRAPIIDLEPDQLSPHSELQGASAPLIDRVIGFVKYDPTSAEHLLRQELLSRSALNALLLGGAQQIPPFPATSLVVKPLFQIIKAGELIDSRYYALKAWEGPPATPQSSPPADWTAVVWIDLLEGGRGGALDLAPAQDGSTRTAETTYPLSSLIHYRLSEFDAAALNADKPDTNARAGDYAILVAMHVAGREIARWTWQTFWWTPNPDDPPAPSSREIASRRPNQLRGAARHYAMAQTYTMLNPDPPYVGGRNVGAAVYAYNPWIEASLKPANLPDSLPGWDPAGQPADNNYGVQSNCMSCHAQANYNPRGLTTAPRPTGARYVDLTDPQFVGTLQVDFLWSIARHAK